MRVPESDPTPPSGPSLTPLKCSPAGTSSVGQVAVERYSECLKQGAAGMTFEDADAANEADADAANQANADAANEAARLHCPCAADEDNC